eukprot:Pgem_evm1s952
MGYTPTATGIWKFCPVRLWLSDESISKETQFVPAIIESPILEREILLNITPLQVQESIKAKYTSGKTPALLIDIYNILVALLNEHENIVLETYYKSGNVLQIASVDAF